MLIVCLRRQLGPTSAPAHRQRCIVLVVICGEKIWPWLGLELEKQTPWGRRGICRNQIREAESGQLTICEIMVSLAQWGLKAKDWQPSKRSWKGSGWINYSSFVEGDSMQSLRQQSSSVCTDVHFSPKDVALLCGDEGSIIQYKQSTSGDCCPLCQHRVPCGTPWCWQSVHTLFLMSPLFLLIV